MTQTEGNGSVPLETLLSIPTLEEKLEHHKVHRITLDEAKEKPEFWAVTALTLGRVFVGACAVYLAFSATESSQLALPALLTASSWVTDYFDGNYARKNEVCTDLGNFLDHGLADLAMGVNTIALPILFFTK